MANSALTLQWGLESTANDAFSVARGLVMAATGDNVPILALLACEKFGGTLPISSMALQKISVVLIRKEPAPVAFLKAKVGFLPNDSAAQLGKSAAGLRFLAFAAAFIPTAGVFQSAIMLDDMLRQSASDLTLVPPREGLRDLLKKLEPRVPPCGFFDSVVFCQKLIEECVVPRVLCTRIPGDLQHNNIQDLKSLMLEGVPPAETIAKLIGAFRQIGRLGSETVTALTIRIGTAVPWVLAFSQWCLDVPISLSVGKYNVLGPSDSKVHILIPDDVKKLKRRFKITTHHQLEQLSTLIQPLSHDILKMPTASYTVTTRMVSLPAYRDYMLSMLGLTNGPLSMIREALEYSIPIFFSHPRMRIRSVDGLSMPDYYPLRPYPEAHIITHTAEKLLGTSTPLVFKYLEGNQTIESLPQVSIYLDQIQQTRCFECNTRDKSSRGTEQDTWSIGYCSQNHFFSSLAYLTIEIFALSLFHDPESLFIQLPTGQGSPFDTLIGFFQDILEKPQHLHFNRPFPDHELMEWAKYLVGHHYNDTSHEPEEVVISCHQGQAIYPAIFQDFQIKKYGYAGLVCLPGVLRFKGETFTVVKRGQIDHSKPSPNFDWQTSFHREHLLEQPSFQDTSISWRIFISHEGTLAATLSWYSKVDKIWKEADPGRLLATLRTVLVSETCTHIGDASVQMAMEGNVYHAPVWQPDGEFKRLSDLHVIRVGRAADQLCFALARVRSSLPVVLGRGACFPCCVQLCRYSAASILLL